MAIHHKAMLWMEGDIYVIPPKCGITSLIRANDVLRVSSLNDRPYNKIILVTRSPQDRLVSAWRNKWPDLTWEEFADMVLDTPDENVDIHLRPQSWFLGGVVPDEVRTIASVAEHKPRNRIPWLNRSDSELFTVGTYRKDEILAYYAEDGILFNQRR